MATFQEVLTEPQAPTLPKGQQTQFAAPATASPFAQLAVGLAGVGMSAIDTLSKVQDREGVDKYVEQIQEIRSKYDDEVSQGAVTADVGKVRMMQDINKISLGLESSRELSYLDAARTTVFGGVDPVEIQEKAQATRIAQWAATGATLRPDLSESEQVEVGRKHSATQTELLLRNQQFQVNAAAASANTVALTQEGIAFNNTMFNSVQSQIDFSMTRALELHLKGDVASQAEAQGLFDNTTKIVESLSNQVNSFLRSTNDPDVHKSVLDNFKERKTQVTTAMEAVFENKTAATVYQLLLDSKSLEAAQNVPGFLQLQALAKGGPAMQGFITGLTQQPEIFGPMIKGLQNIIAPPETGTGRGRDDASNSAYPLLQSQVDPNSTSDLSEEHVSRVFTGSRIILDQILKAPTTEVTGVNAEDYARQMTNVLNLGMSWNNDPEKLLTLSSTYLNNPRALQYMDLLSKEQPDVAQALVIKKMGFVEHSLRAGLKDDRFVGTTEIRTLGRFPGQVTPRNVPVRLSYDPEAGEFIPTLEDGTPVEAFETLVREPGRIGAATVGEETEITPEMQELFQLNTMLNGGLATLTSFAKYDSKMKNLSELDLKNLYVRGMLTTVNMEGSPLVSGKSFPVIPRSTRHTKESALGTTVPVSVNEAWASALGMSRRRLADVATTLRQPGVAAPKVRRWNPETGTFD